MEESILQALVDGGSGTNGGNAAAVSRAGNAAASKNADGGPAVIQATDFVVDVTVTGIDSTGGGLEVTNNLQKTVTVVEAAKIVMNAQIITPAGAVDNTVSTYQTFDIQYWVTNAGEADVVSGSLNDVTLIAPQNFVFSGSPIPDTV